MASILHITTRTDWLNAKHEGVYRAASLATEGFIHCSTVEQTVATANAFFHGEQGLVLLIIDESLVRADLAYEPPADNGEADQRQRFPHIYGPLNLDAVRQVFDFPPDTDGNFNLPDIIVRPG